MKSMTIKLSYWAALLSVFFISCSELCDTDEADTAALQYRVTVEKPIIAGVSYRDANGTIVSTDADFLNLKLWYTHVNVEAPFNALKQVVLVNNYTEEVSYNLGIYLDGELIETKNGSVLPQEQETAIIQYTITD